MATKYEASTREEKAYEKALAAQKIEFQQEKETLLKELQSKNAEILTLQQQLDEARGEISVMKKRHESSLKVSFTFSFHHTYVYVFAEIQKVLLNTQELSKELRRQIRDNNSIEGVSLGSRTSSCSSLNTIETTNNSKAYKGVDTVIPEPQVTSLQCTDYCFHRRHLNLCFLNLAATCRSLIFTRPTNSD